MNEKEINKMIANRYLKWSKISLKIGIISFIISFILIVINTGNSTIQFISSIGLVIAISCIMEYFILKVLCKYMLNKK